MGSVSIEKIFQSYNSNSNSKAHNYSGTSTVEAEAITQAETYANAAAQNSDVSYATVYQGGNNREVNISNNAYNYFGFNYSFTTGKASETTTSFSGGVWHANAHYYATRSGTGFQLKLKLKESELNSLSSSNIASASLNFNYTTNFNNNYSYEFAVCAPQNDHTYNSSNGGTAYIEPWNVDTKSAVTITGGTTHISIDITNVFKTCLDRNKPWVVLIRNANYASSPPKITLTSTPTISYNLTTSACNPPTSVGDNNTGSIVPGGSISISWSGAQAGTGNSIVGYRVYWKKGAEPVIGASDGYYQFESTSSSGNITFNSSSSGVQGTFPSTSDRGETYYFKMSTKGSVLVNNAYYSALSDSYATIKVNQLPDSPAIQVDKSRIKSTGSTTVNFTVTPGYDADEQQTRTVYYSTSIVTPTINNTTLVDNDQNKLSPNLNAAITYYFWTYDGYEFSTNYTPQNIRLNTPPTIGSITMSAVQTFLPSTRNGYVKNINGSASNVTKDSEATSLTYSWKLCIGNTSSATSYTPGSEISTNTSINNIDVTQYGVTFNKCYKLQLTVTDDVGDSATVQSTNVFAIPAAPTVIFYNQHANSDVSTANSSHFGSKVRFKYSAENTGINNIELWYKKNSESSYVKLKDLNRNESNLYSNTTLDELEHGVSYDFKIKFICNKASIESAVITKQRSASLIPTTVTITPTSGISIKPYTQTVFNISFGGQPLSFANSNDVSTTYSNIYSIKLQYGGRELVMTSNGTDSQGTITGTVTLSDKTTTNWINLFGLNNAPNSTYNVSLMITVTNSFEEVFNTTYTPLNLNFVESCIIGSSAANIYILATDNSYQKITGYSSSSRYPLFETQTIRVVIDHTKVTCYANQNIKFTLLQGENILGSSTLTTNNWTGPSGYIYTLSTDVNLNYIIPMISADSNIDFSIKVELDNGTITTYSTGLNICKYCKFNISDINFSITNITNNSATWSWTNYGATNANFSSKSCQLKYCSILTDDFNQYVNNNLGSSFTITTSTSDTISYSIGSMPDILYVGAQLTLTLNFAKIDKDNANSKFPKGEKEYTINLINLNSLYSATPNLGYGQNFFFLNANSPGSNIDGILYIHETGTRNKIYFGNGDIAVFEIDADNGLIIDGGTW